MKRTKEKDESLGKCQQCKREATVWNMEYGKFCSKHYPSFLRNQAPDDFEIPD